MRWSAACRADRAESRLLDRHRENGLSAMTTGPAVQSIALVWQQTWDADAEPLRNVHIVLTLRATMSTRSDNVSLRVDAVLFGS